MVFWCRHLLVSSSKEGIFGHPVVFRMTFKGRQLNLKERSVFNDQSRRLLYIYQVNDWLLREDTDASGDDEVFVGAHGARDTRCGMNFLYAYIYQ